MLAWRGGDASTSHNGTATPEDCLYHDDEAVT